jgi:hypothetical protein
MALKCYNHEKQNHLLNYQSINHSMCWIRACNKIDLERDYNMQIDLSKLIMPQGLKLKD